MFLTGGGGGNSFECALSKGGHSNACRMRAGGGRGSKKAKKLRAHFMYGPLDVIYFNAFLFLL